MKRIRLACEDPSPAFQLTNPPFEIEVEREDETAWWGRPTANAACPTMEYPKFAWREHEKLAEGAKAEAGGAREGSNHCRAQEA